MTESSVRVGDETYRMVHPAAADALIDEEDFDRNERLPYWAELWPSAIALARRVALLDLTGQRVVELGCGLGLPSIAALSRGASVLSTDHYREALDFAAYNTQANLDADFGRKLETLQLDWRTPTRDLPRFDLVLAADVLYDGMNVIALADLVPKLLERNGKLLLADPRRDYAGRFLEAMEQRGFEQSVENATVEHDGRTVEIMLYWLQR